MILFLSVLGKVPLVFQAQAQAAYVAAPVDLLVSYLYRALDSGAHCCDLDDRNRGGEV